MNGMLGGDAVHPVKQGLSWLTGRRVPAGDCASRLASPPTCLLLSPSSVWLPPLEAGCLQEGAPGTEAGRQLRSVREPWQASL